LKDKQTVSDPDKKTVSDPDKQTVSETDKQTVSDPVGIWKDVSELLERIF
jgi:hypothetical protein